MPAVVGVMRRARYFRTADHLRIKGHGIQRLLESVLSRDSR